MQDIIKPLNLRKYYIWRRTIGGENPYVNSSCGAWPEGYIASHGVEVKFKLLKVFDEWTDETVDFILQERLKDNQT